MGAGGPSEAAAAGQGAPFAPLPPERFRALSPLPRRTPSPRFPLLTLSPQTIREAQARRALLPPDHPASQLVRRVGRRVAAVASDGEGGGYSRHMKHQEWEFAVINDPQVNAFVVRSLDGWRFGRSRDAARGAFAGRPAPCAGGRQHHHTTSLARILAHFCITYTYMVIYLSQAPGGKVVVYTGLLGLMTSEDELAAVIAHEAAHVVARHIAENLSRMQARVWGGGGAGVGGGAECT